jgi:hypothetical protein
LTRSSNVQQWLPAPTVSSFSAASDAEPSDTEERDDSSHGDEVPSIEVQLDLALDDLMHEGGQDEVEASGSDCAFVGRSKIDCGAESKRQCDATEVASDGKDDALDRQEAESNELAPLGKCRDDGVSGGHDGSLDAVQTYQGVLNQDTSRDLDGTAVGTQRTIRHPTEVAVLLSSRQPVKVKALHRTLH